MIIYVIDSDGECLVISHRDSAACRHEHRKCVGMYVKTRSDKMCV